MSTPAFLQRGDNDFTGAAIKHEVDMLNEIIDHHLFERDRAFDVGLIDLCRKIGTTYHRQNEARHARSFIDLNRERVEIARVRVDGYPTP